MDDSSSSEEGFWSSFKKIFKHRHDSSLEESIKDALEEGEVQAEDVNMLLNVLELEERYVYEVMVPRTDIVCADIEEGASAIVDLIRKHGHSRIPIFKGDKDNIIGIVHAKDLLIRLWDNTDSQVDLNEVMRPPLFIPENKDARNMLQEFRKSKIHLAIAVDEYGGTSGLLTLEDVLEEIVGEIEDEHDTEGPAEIQELKDGSFLISGRLELEELNSEFQMSLHSDQVETIGGFLCEKSGHVPQQGELFTLEGHRFTVKEADKKQIRWIHVNIVTPPTE